MTSLYNSVHGIIQPSCHDEGILITFVLNDLKPCALADVRRSYLFCLSGTSVLLCASWDV